MDDFTDEDDKETVKVQLIICPACGAANPFPANGDRPQTCRTCDASLEGVEPKG